MKKNLNDLQEISISDKQKKLINDNIKVIFDVINNDENYKKMPKSIKDDLSSYGYTVISSNINNYKEGDNVYTFMKNILRYSLKNYYNRHILGYKQKYSESEMTTEEITNKKVYDEIYSERMLNWKKDLDIWNEYKKEWEKTYSEPFTIEKPIRPTKTYYSIQKRVVNTEIQEDTMMDTSWNIIEDDKKDIIRNTIETLSPIKQKFVIEVFYNDRLPKLVVKELNKEILDIMNDVKFKIEMCDMLNINRNTILNYDMCGDNPIQDYVYKKIFESKEPIDKIYKKIKAKNPILFKNNILDELKRKLEVRFK